MNAATPHALLIAHGRNAGQPRHSSERLLDRLRTAMAAVVVLKRNGHEAIDIDHMNGLTPRVWIENSARCAELSEACTVKWGFDALGAYQVREIKLDAVRVCWIVRGH